MDSQSTEIESISIAESANVEAEDQVEGEEGRIYTFTRSIPLYYVCMFEVPIKLIEMSR